jgi:hypothetical protein
MKKAKYAIDINRPQFHADSHKGLPLQNTQAVKEKLLEELIELEKQSNQLRMTNDSVDFSMMQTYKEMIHSRKMMFRDLSS